MPRLRALLTPVLALATAVGGVVAAGTPAHAASGFAAGDVVVYRVGTGSAPLSSAGTAAFLDEFSTSGAPVQSLALPTTASGSNKRLVAGGSAGSEGELNLSADGRLLVATGYNAAVGSSSPGSASAGSVSRTVALVGADDSIDTSTSLTDAFSANNVRGATTVDGTGVYVSGADGASGVRYATRGASTSSTLTSSATTNFRDPVIAGSQLYVSADPGKNSTSTTVASVGSGLPTSGTNPVANLAFSAAPTGPYAFTFLTLGSGSAPDTLYVADNGAGAVVKYALTSGSWVKRGSATLSGVTGVTADDVNGVAKVYATTPGGLFTLSDSSGQGGTLSAAPTQIAAATANTAFRGVAFAPGTTIGSGPGPVASVPTIALAHTGLPAAVDDPTNPTDQVSVGDDQYPASRLSVTATSSNQQVAADGGVSVTGSGATRTVTITPAGAVGTATVTLTVTAPDGSTATASLSYAVSAGQGDSSDRYYSGAGNASAAIDVGDGYMVVGDDESDVLHLYDQTRSGPPVASFDFTAKLPYGSAEVDIEGAARVGDTIYWTGSMSNNSKGAVAPARSTVFATTVSGSGASTTLTYAGAYTGLQSDLVAWDDDDGHGLGARYLGFDDSVNGGTANHSPSSFNVEGLEFSATDDDTAYFAFRGPLEPTTDRHLALVVPVTNLPQLVSGAASSATFGAPLFWDLGGLGIRDIRRNADGDYLVLAGSADDANDDFSLYTWDGDPADPPLPGQSLPLVPAGGAQGSWESIVSTPDPLDGQSQVRLLEDNGTTAWYGNGDTSKAGLPSDLQKDLGRVFAYQPPSRIATTTMLASSPDAPTAGQSVTYTATVASTTDSGTPRGTVALTDAGASVDGCSAVPVSADGTATCSVVYPAAGAHQVSAAYQGSSSYAGSASAADDVSVARAATTTSLTVSAEEVAVGQEVTYTATVGSGPATASGTVAFDEDSGDSGGVVGDCGSQPVGSDGTATCTVSYPHAGVVRVTAAYSGDDATTSSASDAVTTTVDPATSTVSLDSDDDEVVTGQPVTFTATVSPGTATGTVSFSADGRSLDGCGAIGLDQVGQAQCTVPAGFQPSTQTITASYSGDADDQAATSPDLDETVDRADASVAVTADPDQPQPGHDLVVAAAISPVAPGAGTPSGTATFTVTGPRGGLDCTAGNRVDLDSAGEATCTIPGSEVRGGGDYDAAVSYSGDAGFTAADGSLDRTAARRSSATTVTSSAATVRSGQVVAFRAVVAAGGSGSDGGGSAKPTGSVTFTITGQSGKTVACGTDDTVRLVGGAARCQATRGSLVAADGPYEVSVSYSGDDQDAPSTGDTQQQVSRIATRITVAQSAAPSRAGDAVTFTATVVVPSTAPTPTGSPRITVEDRAGSTVECDPGSAQPGEQSCTVPTGVLTHAGSLYSVTATYDGDGDDTSSSRTVRHGVTR